jgi:hypothetical protein
MFDQIKTWDVWAADIKKDWSLQRLFTVLFDHYYRHRFLASQPCTTCTASSWEIQCLLTHIVGLLTTRQFDGGEPAAVALVIKACQDVWAALSPFHQATQEAHHTALLATMEACIRRRIQPVILRTDGRYAGIAHHLIDLEHYVLRPTPPMKRPL